MFLRFLRFLVYHVWMVAGSFSGVSTTTRTITLACPGVLQIKAASDELARHGSIVWPPGKAAGLRPIFEPIQGHFSFLTCNNNGTNLLKLASLLVVKHHISYRLTFLPSRFISPTVFYFEINPYNISYQNYQLNLKNELVG